MGDPRGFLTWPAKPAGERPVADRLADYREFVLERTPTEMTRQAGRCMDCGVPFCHQGCPLGNAIPDFNELVHRDRWRAAHAVLASTNDFPEFTGRLCPAPCEKACVLAINDDAVTIEQLEREIIERAFAQGWVVPQPPTQRSGQTVAVVGSGPAGLAAAQRLNRAGHTVTVYDGADKAGGLLRYGIPDFKLDRAILDRRLALMREEGVQFALGQRIEGEGWQQLRDQHDAVVLCMGAGKARQLTVPGADKAGVHLAMTYLEHQNRVVADADFAADGELNAKNKTVVVLGGGDTGSDCHGTALRQGATSVHSLEWLDAPPETRSDDNPWPRWPRVFRTSSSHREGGERDFGIETMAFVGDERVEGLQCRRVSWESGRPVPVEGSEFVLPADLVLLAVGFLGPQPSGVVAKLGLGADSHGRIQRDKTGATNVPGVFAAGDVARGPSLIVWALAEGREAARGVDAYLRGLAVDQSQVPTRGLDHPFAA